MILHLFVSTLMVLFTVALHGGGLAFLGWLVRSETQAERVHHVPAMSRRGMFFTLFIVVTLFGLHGMEIWLYAALFTFLGAVENFETAVYFSTISYGGIGYDDRYIISDWRLLAAIEGINGVLLLGWSTAFFVTMVSRLGRD
jgi:hypothetical protein